MPVPSSSIMFVVPQTNGNGNGSGSVVLCSKCGIPMQPNASNMCVECLCSEVDIKEGLPRRMQLVYCPECESYLQLQQQRPRSWVELQSKSKEFLAFCLEKLRWYMNTKNANIAVTLLHAEFMYGDGEHPPPSRMLNLKVRVQKVVLNGAILEFSHPVEVAERESKHMYCESCCSRVAQEQAANPDPHHWLAAVQLRQHHVSHWRTFFYLEQRILNRRAAATAVGIIKKQIMDDQAAGGGGGGGIDFFFSNPRHAFKLMGFIRKVAPVTSRVDKQLVSHDPKTYKRTFSAEISPICRNDLICLLPPDPNPNPTAAATLVATLGGPLVICTMVAKVIVLLNPCNLRHRSLDADQYWSAPFQSLLTSTQLVEYIVLRVDVGDVPSEVTVGGTKYVLADAQVARVKDYFGNKKDTTFSIKTHLGHLLKPGDYALGYDLLYGADSNTTDSAAVDLPAAAILIKKSYQVKRHKRHRSWKLKSLDMEVDDKEGRVEQDKMDSEYEQFLNDLEENPDLRFGISLYRNHDYQPSEMMALETDGEELPSVPWEELRADLDPNEEDNLKWNTQNSLLS